MKVSSILIHMALLLAAEAATMPAYADIWTVYKLKSDIGVKVEAESMEVTSGGALIFTNSVNGTKKIIKIFSPWSFTYAERELQK